MRVNKAGGLMLTQIQVFVRSDNGIESVEFAVLAAILVGAVVLAMTAVMFAITGRWGETSELINP
jgi:Flp pilus assembly pilin Flp